MSRRRHFGSIRKRASGRYQARYTGPDGQTYSAPETFERKTDAARWLSVKETEISRGDWTNPDAGSVPFENYADQWLADRVLKAGPGSFTLACSAITCCRPSARSRSIGSMRLPSVAGARRGLMLARSPSVRSGR